MGDRNKETNINISLGIRLMYVKLKYVRQLKLTKINYKTILFQKNLQETGWYMSPKGNFFCPNYCKIVL